MLTKWQLRFSLAEPVNREPGGLPTSNLFRAITPLPILGLVKQFDDAAEVYFTPDFASAQAVADAGADIIALDCTRRCLSAPEPWPYLIDRIYTELNRIVCADIATVEDAIKAQNFGAAVDATTLCGYRTDTYEAKSVPWILVDDLVRNIKSPVILDRHVIAPDEFGGTRQGASCRRRICNYWPSVDHGPLRWRNAHIKLKVSAWNFVMLAVWLTRRLMNDPSGGINMAHAMQESSLAVEPAGAANLLPLVLMLALYFGIGFITALNDILIPHFKDLFHLTNVAALLVQFCFFGAYFIMAVPSGVVVGRIGYKASIVAALMVMGLGLLLFVPASIIIYYPLFLSALFVVGSGLALLQVAINPYVGALGSPATASSRLNLAGGFNSIATTIAPKVGASFIFIAAGASVAQLAHSVRAPYAILSACALVLAAATWFVPLPHLIEKGSDILASKDSALNFRHLRFGALGIFFYVGAEVAIGSILITYLGQRFMGGLTHLQAARYVSYYWGGAMLGRFAGFFVLRKTRAQHALAVVSLAAATLVAISMSTHGHLAMTAIVSCGLCNSIMWPCIFPLSVSGLGRATSQGSGILVTMVVGGAIIPEVQGFLADKFGYRQSFAVVLLCYAYILFFALNGHKEKVDAG